MDKQLRADLFSAADKSLLSGVVPVVSELAAQSDLLSEAQAEGLLSEWWQTLPSRIRFEDRDDLMPEIPESMRQAFARLWQQAVQEASSGIRLLEKRSAPQEGQMQRERDEALKRSQGEMSELEQRFREQGVKLDQAGEQSQALETELKVLRQQLANETTVRNKEEQLRCSVEQELVQLRKAYEETKRVFDQRVRDEQRHNLEAVAKVDVDMRHYRNALEKLRDESGRREAELTREVHELHNRLARRDAKIETLSNQLRSHDDALSVRKSTDAQLQRDLNQLTSQLLSETNKSKRCEEQLRAAEESLQKIKQKQAADGGESVRRENQLRAQLKERDEALIKAQARAEGLEKRSAALEEEVRRLKQRA